MKPHPSWARKEASKLLDKLESLTTGYTQSATILANSDGTIAYSDRNMELLESAILKAHEKGRVEERGECAKLTEQLKHRYGEPWIQQAIAKAIRNRATNTSKERER